MFDIKAVKCDLDIGSDSDDDIKSDSCPKEANSAKQNVQISRFSIISTRSKLRSNPTENIEYLSVYEELRIRKWFEYKEEYDPDIITELIERCRNKIEAKAYYLMRSNEVPEPSPRSVTCSVCRYFKRIDHPHLGHCENKQLEAIAGLWDSDRRHCSLWLMQDVKVC